MKKLALFILLPITLIAAIYAIDSYLSLQPNTIATPSDYEHYLTSDISQKATPSSQNEKKLAFWEKKLQGNPNSGLYKLKVAGIYAERFKQKGTIQDIHTSDSLLLDALSKPMLKKAGLYHSLSANAITKHQFKEALAYADQALATQEAPETSQLMRFDALLELGQVEEAAKALEIFAENKNQGAFDYLVRKSKLHDAQGNLNLAIETLERTKPWLAKYDNVPLYTWTMSNLGDMYGHAGLIEKSYANYLKVLERDPTYYYALKGIAWIAFSYDKDLKQARSIVNYLKTVQPSPDLDLMLADMAEYETNETLKEEYIAAFRKQVNKAHYGQMYHSHLADLYLSEKSKVETAKFYIEQEIAHRPTAHAYLLLARYHHEKGEYEQAMEILEKQVMDKTEEPDVLYHIGVIAYAAGDKSTAQKYLKESADAGFELGPNVAKEIDSLLESL